MPRHDFYNATAVPVAGTTTTTKFSGLANESLLTIFASFAYGSGGTSAKAYLQTTFDNGATWIDIACAAFTNANATKLFNISAGGSLTAATAPTDGALADNTALDGVIGDQLRVKLMVVGTYVASTMTFVVSSKSGAGGRAKVNTNGSTRFVQEDSAGNTYGSRQMFTCTIANGANISSVVDLSGGSGRTVVDLVMGDLTINTGVVATDQASFDASGWDAADILFLGSIDGRIYTPVYRVDGAGRVRVVTPTAAGGMPIDPADFAGWPFLKLVSVNAGLTTAKNQTALRTLTVVARSL